MPPMHPASEFQILRPGLAYWQAYDPAVKTDLGCCAFETPAGLILTDPVPLEESALEELTAGRPPHAILLTSANHERNASDLAHRFGIDLWAHSAATGLVAATRWFEDGEKLFGAAEAVYLDGFAPGEAAFWLDGALLVGDALINVPPYGFAMLPDKYCADPKAGRSSLKALLRFPVEILTFAHGLPIVSRARERLAELIAQ
jgi:hypothetical protein